MILPSAQSLFILLAFEIPATHWPPSNDFTCSLLVEVVKCRNIVWWSGSVRSRRMVICSFQVGTLHSCISFKLSTSTPKSCKACRTSWGQYGANKWKHDFKLLQHFQVAILPLFPDAKKENLQLLNTRIEFSCIVVHIVYNQCVHVGAADTVPHDGVVIRKLLKKGQCAWLL